MTSATLFSLNLINLSYALLPALPDFFGPHADQSGGDAAGTHLPAPPLSGMAVTASLSSHVMLNQHLLEAVMGKSPSLRVVFSAYKDFTCILLCPSESGVYKFPKSGRIKDIAFSRSPVEAGSPCRPATRRRGIPHTADRWACWIR